MKITLDNFRIIEHADIEVEGITLIRGQNDSGKSTAMRALKTIVKNESGDGCIRYGAPGFSISLEIPTREQGTRSVTFSRKRGGSPLLKIDTQKNALEKLGRLNINDIDPTFPLKVIDYGDDKFMPQFVFQKQVPVFGQVDVYQFFSSMFESVALLSKHNLKVRARVSAATQDANSLKAKAEGVMGSLNQVNAALEGIDRQETFLRFSQLEAAEALEGQLAQADTTVASLTDELGSLQKYEVLGGLDFNAIMTAARLLDSVLALFDRYRDLAVEEDGLRQRLAQAVAAEASVQRLEGLRATLQAADDLRHLLARYDALVARQGQLEAGLGAAASAEQGLASLQLLHETVSNIARLSVLRGQYATKSDKMTRLFRAMAVMPQVETVADLVQGLLDLKKAAARAQDCEGHLTLANATLEECRKELADIKICPVCGNPVTLDTHPEEHHG